MANTKTSSTSLASIASKTLRNPNTSTIQKSLAGSVLAQSGTSKTTGSSMETKAGKALQRNNSSPLTKSLAGSVVSQSDK
ncbi:hypothetical protein RFF20_00365 [Pasteurella multocida]|uniref:hypothetical protein n=1 Tax=Pasteurella multocida TaxID=747 RepID=UPI00193C6F99|nr:hypothetical protein [Pasteurella multocida]MBM2608943.1 hypothetical protein [Pasteurella multocida]WRK09477.1 hypothetical protein RFF20_00365 [Pasteurella multocida]